MNDESLFHKGELAVQMRVGVRDEALQTGGQFGESASLNRCAPRSLGR